MIGQTVYLWDENRRVYSKAGGVGRAPIWREHWRPLRIVGETSRSWVLEYGSKIAKNRTADAGFAWTQADIDKQEWVEVHAFRLMEVVRRQPYETLKQIAGLIGYVPKEP